MSGAHSTGTPPPGKPPKPYPDFPLFAHATKRWAKKIRGRLHYFGPWSDPDGALACYLAQKDDLHAGRKPRAVTGEVTVKDVANAFLNAKQEKVNTGEIAPRTFLDLKEAAALVVKQFGTKRLVADLRPEDFAALRARAAKRWGPVRLRNVICRVRAIFKHARLNGIIDREVAYGTALELPSQKTLRLERARKGLRMFEAPEILRMLDAAGQPLRTMILLGVNCGFGPSDLGNLPVGAVDLERGWVNYPRPKTGIDRRCPLWPETIEAVREALARRPTPKDPAHAGLVFITQRGLTWAKDVPDSPLSKETRKLLDRLGIGGARNFYGLRRTFETIGGEAKDQVAVDHIMGHVDPGMAAVYRQRISDERLKAVADHVREWLFGKPAEEAKPRGKARKPRGDGA